MVKHIVLFKLKDEVPAEGKLEVMTKFKEAIEALPAKISVIRKVEVGLNMNPGETWNIALYSEFDTLEDVRFYATHPDHVAAGKILAETKESRAIRRQRWCLQLPWIKVGMFILPIWEMAALFPQHSMLIINRVSSL